MQRRSSPCTRCWRGQAAAGAKSRAELRKNVTSKGGTTEAALKVFDEEQLAQRFARALEAASRRGADIGAELGELNVGQIDLLVDTVVTFIVFLLLARFFCKVARSVPQPGRRIPRRHDQLDRRAGAPPGPGGGADGLGDVAPRLDPPGARNLAAGGDRRRSAEHACHPRGALVDLVRFGVYILVFAVIVQAVLSW